MYNFFPGCQEAGGTLYMQLVTPSAAASAAMMLVNSFQRNFFVSVFIFFTV